jgi:hypothetical protein
MSLILKLNTELILLQGDKHFLPSKDVESRQFLADSHLVSVVVNELHSQYQSNAQMAKVTSNSETCQWRMYNMRRNYLDGRDGQLGGASCDKPRLWDSESIDSDHDDHGEPDS